VSSVVSGLVAKQSPFPAVVPLTAGKYQKLKAFSAGPQVRSQPSSNSMKPGFKNSKIEQKAKKRAGCRPALHATSVAF
jgi:hypothetical protein